MIKALVIDDEPSAVNVMQMLVKRHVPEITELHTAIGSEEGVRKINETNPELVFLDIKMPGMSGFELLEKFYPKHDFEIIFITAYDQFAIKAIKFSAIDYLVKPIAIDELKSAVERFISKRESHADSTGRIKNFINNIHQEAPRTFKLALPTSNGTTFLHTDEIIRCKADSNYTFFYLLNKKSILTSKTLKEYEDILSDHEFIRVHKSHLVNKKYVKSMIDNNILVMDDESQVEISRRKTAWVKVKLGIHQSNF